MLTLLLYNWLAASTHPQGTGDGKITQEDVDVQDELYKRWKMEQKHGPVVITEQYNTLVRAMGMAWLSITRAKKKAAVRSKTIHRRKSVMDVEALEPSSDGNTGSALDVLGVSSQQQGSGTQLPLTQTSQV